MRNLTNALTQRNRADNGVKVQRTCSDGHPELSFFNCRRQLVNNLENALMERDWANDEDGLRGVLHAAHQKADAPGEE